MTPTSIPNMTPEEAVALLRRMGLSEVPSAPVPLSEGREGQPLGAPTGARTAPSASDLYADTPAPLGRPEPQIMPQDNSTMAALLMAPPALKAAGAAAPYVARALTASPLLTAGATGAAAAGLPSATGMTQWEVMQGNWDARRQAIQQQIAEQQRQMEEARAGHVSRAPQRPVAPKATANKARGEMASGNYARELEMYPGLAREHEAALSGVLTPYQQAVEGLRGQQAAIDEEIKQSQTPLREAHPWAGVALPPVAWMAAALTGGKIGKFGRGLQESVAERIRGGAQRGADQLARGRGAFGGPEGRAVASELQALEGKGVAPVATPIASALAGGTAGTIEGALAPLGLTAIDAISKPSGSPAAAAAMNAPYTPEYWWQVLPEMATAGLAGSLGGMVGALKRPSPSRFSKPQFGPPDAPIEQVRSMAREARTTKPPSPPKPKPKKSED